ncbi:MAG TPA: CaiB/BaiF CoA-transferase family protein [Chloroflexota bacterium]
MVSGPLHILSGIKIAAFTQFLLGPAAVQYLSDLGADVVKVEQPGTGAWERTWAGGDTFVNGVSVFFLLANRNVRSLALNLKSAEGLEVARKLIAGSDVLVQNFRPGVMDRLGLGYEEARKINPRLIYASASGFGEDELTRDMPGQDLLLQAFSGLMAITGTAGETPHPAGAAVVDQHGASLLAMGILAALMQRGQTGKGQKIEVSMLQSALDLQLEPITYYLNGGALRRPQASLGSTFHQAPYGVYQTADGYLAISITAIKALGKALGGVPELEPYEDPDVSLSKREEIFSILAPILRRRSSQDWLDLLRPQGIWCSAVNDYEQLFADPIIRHLEPILEIDHPIAGPVRVLKHPVRYSDGEPELRQIPPLVGQHSDEILGELGYCADQIERLRAAKVI